MHYKQQNACFKHARKWLIWSLVSVCLQGLDLPRSFSKEHLEKEAFSKNIVLIRAVFPRSGGLGIVFSSMWPYVKNVQVGDNKKSGERFLGQDM
jgi:hypothetical protein